MNTGDQWLGDRPLRQKSKEIKRLKSSTSNQAPLGAFYFSPADFLTDLPPLSCRAVRRVFTGTPGGAKNHLWVSASLALCPFRATAQANLKANLHQKKPKSLTPVKKGRIIMPTNQDFNDETNSSLRTR
jgi:hypothetical protein